MITSLFRKSTPLNYALVFLGTVIFFLLYQNQQATGDTSAAFFMEKFVLLGFILASLFVSNFIVKKNGLSKDSAYVVLFCFLFLLFFPSVLNNFNLIVANFFVLLALRRLISLHSLKAAREKIFDASLWIFVASLFHFWSILFIGLVFIAILFQFSRDYRNWLLPFIAFFGALVPFLLFAFIFDVSRIDFVLESMKTNYKLDYFTNNFQNLALSIYVTIALFFLVSLVFSLSNRPLMLHSSYKKMISSFFIGILIFVLSPVKSNELLLFTFTPLAVMATAHIEMTQLKWQKELILAVVIVCGLFAFFSQL